MTGDPPTRTIRADLVSMRPRHAIRPSRRALAPLVRLGGAALMLAFNATWVAASLGPLHKPHRVHESDHHHYLAMARRDAGLAGGERAELGLRAPYCWRPLVPAIAGWLARRGWPLNLAFYMLTNAALLAFLYLLALELAERGFDERWQLAGVALAATMQGAVRWFEYQYWMTDPAGLALLAWSLRLARRERLGRLALLAGCGALVRETWVLVLPYLAVRLARRYGWRAALGRTLLAAAPGLAVSGGLRLAIVPAVHPGLLDSVTDNLGFRWRHLFDNQLYLLGPGTWGAMLPLALLPLIRRGRRARRRPEGAALLAAVYLSTFLISNNNERPLAYALPVLLPAALEGLRSLLRQARRVARRGGHAPGLAVASVAAVVFGVQALHFAVTRFEGLGISVYQPMSWPVTLACLGLWLAGLALLATAGARPRRVPAAG